MYGLYRDYVGTTLGLYWDYIGIIRDNIGVILRLDWHCIGVVSALYRDHYFGVV